MTRDDVLGLFARGQETRVKLCGMSRAEDVDAANAAGPDLVGFVVDFPRSRRNVPAALLGSLSRCVAPDIVRVGVFVDEPVEVVAQLYESGALDVAQLHGHEGEAYLQELRERCNIPVIQAFRVRSAEDVERSRQSSAELVLLDNGQGTGESFDWALVADVGRPFLLAGGLGPQNVADAIATIHPWGVDMSSGIETDGIKDKDKMRAAVAAVRNARRGLSPHDTHDRRAR